MYSEWVHQIEHTLYNAVQEYIALRKKQRYDSTIKATHLRDARNKIMPIWRAIVKSGENWDSDVRLHISVHDVEDLVGFGWKFVYRASAGVAEVEQGRQVFRRLVESLIGCMMAKSAYMSEDDYKKVKEYDGLVSGIEKAGIRLDEIKVEQKAWASLIKENTSDDFKDFIRGEINALEAETKELKAKMAEDATRITTVERTIRNIEGYAFKKIPV